MMVLENKYDLGQIVYLVTDTEQLRRIVTQIKVLPSGISYRLSCGTTDSDHYECEITKEINVLAKID